jgi:hypothetical protein
MRSAFPEPVLTITPAAVRDLQGREALSGLWTLFTKCKESLQDGRRLENISWRLWYREIMRDGAAVTPNLSRVGSSGSLCEEKAEKEKHMDSEKNDDESHSIPPPSAPTFTRTPGLQHPLVAPAPIPTPQSPPPTYVFGFDFGSKDQDDRIREQGALFLLSFLPSSFLDLLFFFSVRTSLRWIFIFFQFPIFPSIFTFFLPRIEDYFCQATQSFPLEAFPWFSGSDS